MIRTQIGVIEGLKDPVAASRIREIKAVVEEITARTPNRKQIQLLGADATLSGVINKLNELINQLQQ